MNFIHKELAAGRWYELSLAEQLGNIGSEFYRATSLRQKGDAKNSDKSFEETLSLLDLTISDKRWVSGLKELTRLREVICDQMVEAKIYDIRPSALHEYFLTFGVVARNGH